MSERLTLATSTGLPFLSLAFHVATGLVAFGAGFVAITVRKGGTWHRRAGVVFAYAMIATGIMATAIALYEGKADFGGGVVTAYLVLTGFTAVRPLPSAGRPVHITFMALAFTLATFGYIGAFKALDTPGNQLEGVPAGMRFFMTTVLLLAAIGDAKMLRAGGIHGSRRLARHLWRMCFGLFIASGSFLLGQMKFIPEPIRNVPLLFVVALSPLAFLGYWMWRVRLKQNLRGLTTARPIDARIEPGAAA